MGRLNFLVNNGGIMELTQDKTDGNVTVHTWHNDKDIDITDGDTVIPPEDFVMLINLYRDIKEHDIQNDYINYYGKNREE